MREAFGDVRIAQTANGIGIEALGLSAPALLLAPLSGHPLPDLTPYIGQVIGLVAHLEAPVGNLQLLRLHAIDISLPVPVEGEPPKAISPLWAVVSGWLGDTPKVNQEGKGDRVVGSLAYAQVPGQAKSASWLRISGHPEFSIRLHMLDLEKGSNLLAYGALSSYRYDEKDYCEMAVRSIQKLPGGSGAPKPPEVLLAGRGEDPDAGFTDFPS